MADITAETMNRVIELVPAKLLEVEGFTYIDKDKSVTLFKPPAPESFGVKTLDGFVQTLEAGLEGWKPEDNMILVESYNAVQLVNRGSDKYGRRQVVLSASQQKIDRPFQFNTYMPQEEFVIALASQFVQTDSLKGLIAVAGNLAKTSEVKQEDNGITQRVTMAAGVVMKTEKVIEPRVTLKPFRTFLEVEQPDGDFIFRVRFNERSGNECALFEADGGKWKLTAVDLIKNWLKQRCSTSTVPAVAELPVIA